MLLGSGCSDPAPTVDLCGDMVAYCVSNHQTCVTGPNGPECQPCPEGNYVGSTGKCLPIPGTPLSHDFPDITIPSGQESLGGCRSWTLNNPVEIWVNTVELVQDEMSHHSNWTYGPDTAFDGPDGIWTCADRQYDFYTGAEAGG